MKSYINSLLVSLLLIISFQSFSANYYVSVTGNDSNTGLSATSPFKTIQKAANLTNPGDVVFVMNGIYTNSCSVCDGIHITRSGTNAAWIKYTNYPGHTPKIKFNSWAGVKVFGAAYIEISGFEIEGNNANITLSYAQSQAGNVNNPTTSGNGIYIENNGNAFAHHVKILNNNIHDCGGHGIGSHWADYITIEKNKIFNNAWYSPLGCSGISLYQNKNADSGTGYRIRIASNTIYNNQMFIPFFYNGKIEDGNGMIIDDARNTQNGSIYGKYNGAIRVENNLVFDNGGKGIHAYLSDNMDAVNNTCYQNCKSPHVKDGELSAYGCSNVRFYNNVTYSRSDARANHDGDGSSTNIVFNNNIYFNYSTSFKLTKGAGDIVADPKFIAPLTNPTTANFKLQSSSPAIDKGTAALAPTKDLDNNNRPLGAGYEIGAYEFVSSTPPPTNTAPTVLLTSPANKSSFISGFTINIAANAADANGTVSKVEFFRGSTKLGEDLTSPYSFAWTNTIAGTYSITAKATDNAGATTTSSAVSVTVTASGNTPPSVSLTSPVKNASFAAGATINIAANASDANGTISKVEFFRGTTKLGEDLTTPYTWAWANATTGTHSITAKATDNAGAVTTSTAVSVMVGSSTTSNTCITKSIPPASSWVVRNNWTDQTNGSGVSNNTESLVITHRQWGNTNLWLVETGKVYNLIAGKEYTISFDYKDDARNKLVSLEVGFSKSYDGSGVTLVQPTILAPAGFSASSYTTKSVKFSATTSGSAYLTFKLNWASQPNLLTYSNLKNLSVCVPGTSFRLENTESSTSSKVTLYPNPSTDYSLININTSSAMPLSLQIFDALGNMLWKIETVTNKDEMIGENLRSGIYFIEANYEEKKEVLKWIKQ